MAANDSIYCTAQKSEAGPDLLYVIIKFSFCDTCQSFPKTPAVTDIFHSFTEFSPIAYWPFTPYSTASLDSTRFALLCLL